MMATQKEVFSLNPRESILRDEIAEIIYSADWEVKGTLNERTNDIIEHYMIDEDEVVEAIIKTIQEADRR